MNNRHLLYFDIETVADETRSELWLAKQEKILSDGKEFIPALYPEFCKVVALGWALDDESPKSLVINTEKVNTTGTLIKVTENIILKTFWKLVSTNSPTLIGFNILNFDLPVIFVRSALTTITPTRLIDRRPWGNDCVDLLETRRYTNGGGKLKELAKYFGFDVPAQDVDGSQVEGLLKDNPSMLANYVESDVSITRQLYKFYKGYFVSDYTPPAKQVRESAVEYVDIE